jgi:exodeoxyribonuclease-5
MTQLSQDQEAAVSTFLDFLMSPEVNVAILQGGAGTGKSFLVKHFIEIAKNYTTVLTSLLNEDKSLHFALTATTNTAASVLGEFVELPATSIHSFLNLYVRDDYKNGKQILTKSRNFDVIRNCLVIIDEASMVDSALLKVIRESTLHCKVLYVGDAYQLPPVFEAESPVFSQKFLTIDLDTQHRTTKIADLDKLSKQFISAINTGVFTPIKTNGTNIIHLDGEAFQKQLVTNFQASTDPFENRILTYTNSKSIQYNKFIRSLYCTSTAPFAGECLISNGVLKQRDAVIIGNNRIVRIVNTLPAMRDGIPGYDCTVECLGGNSNVISIVYGVFIPENYDDVTAHIKYYESKKDWRNFFQLKNGIADLRQVYSSTIHKAQGSTCKNTFINLNDIGKCTNPNMVARMLYVALTRATDNIYLYGELPEKYGGACV